MVLISVALDKNSACFVYNNCFFAFVIIFLASTASKLIINAYKKLAQNGSLNKPAFWDSINARINTR